MNVRTIRRGVVNVWVILVMFMLIGLVGLACDCGWIVLVLTQLQSAADAAALAGAQQVKYDQDMARQWAMNYGAYNHAALDPVQLNANTGNDDNGDIVIGRWSTVTQSFTPTTTTPNAVKVNARKYDSSLNGALDLVFGPVFAVPTVNIERSAIAVSLGFGGGGILVLDPTQQCALDIGGNATVTVSNGGVQVNSSSNCAACSNGNPTLNVPDLYVHGTSCVNSSVMVGNVYNGAPVVPDPLAHLPAPNTNGMPVFNSLPVGDIKNLVPGVYPNGIDNSGNNVTINLASGIYVVGSMEVTGGNINDNGNGVMIYLASGALDLRGNGIIALSPMTTGTYAGVTIFQARNNTTGAQINGTNNLNITGTIYFPAAELELLGTGDGFGNQIIANTVHVSGNANVTVNYSGFANDTNRVFLVR